MVTVFIVDDDPTIQHLYKLVLDTKKDCELIGQALDGIEAVKMYKKFKKKPDVIIMDHRVPLKNGIEMSKEILEINKKQDIVFATADESIVDEAKKIGITHFLDKPFDMETLVNSILKFSKK